MDDKVVLGLLGIVTTVIGLFGWLLKYVMNENSRRENEYRNLITEQQKIIVQQQQVIADQQRLIAEQRHAIMELRTKLETK